MCVRAKALSKLRRKEVILCFSECLCVEAMLFSAGGGSAFGGEPDNYFCLEGEFMASA
jgi:hypothetical protein